MERSLKWRRRAASLVSLRASAVSYSSAKFYGIEEAGIADFVTKNVGGLPELANHNGGAAFFDVAWRL